MSNSFQQYRRLYYRISDLIVLNLCFFIALWVRFGIETPEIVADNEYLSLLLFYNLAWLATTSADGAYSLNNYSATRWKNFGRQARTIALHLLLIVAFNGLIKTYYSRLFIFYSYLGMVVFIPIARYMVLAFIKSSRDSLGLESRVGILGNGNVVMELQHYFDTESSRKEFVTSFLEGVEDNQNILESAKRFISENQLTELYVGISHLTAAEVHKLVQLCEERLVRVRLILDYPRINLRPLQLVKYEQVPVIPIPVSPLDDPLNRLIKRSFDLVFSTLVILLLLSWLIPLIGILIKLSSKGPVFFIQKRSGYNNKVFYCFKFRSMRLNKEADIKQATGNDPRIFPLGKFLRNSSIDELPQFINVFIGNMSVVGPRPHMVKHTEEYSEQISSFLQRHAIKPGITGLAQAKGFRGEINSRMDLASRIKYDLFYVENWSLLLDVKIIILTIISVFKKHP